MAGKGSLSYQSRNRLSMDLNSAASPSRSPMASTLVEVDASDLEALLSTVETYRAKITLLEAAAATSADATDQRASHEAEIRELESALLDQDVELQNALQELGRKDARIRALEAALSEAARRHETEAAGLRLALAAQEAEAKRLSSECAALRLDLERARAVTAELEETFHQGVAADDIDLLADTEDHVVLEDAGGRKGLGKQWPGHDDDREPRRHPSSLGREGSEGKEQGMPPPQAPLPRSPRRYGAGLDLAESLLRSDASGQYRGRADRWQEEADAEAKAQLSGLIEKRSHRSQRRGGTDEVSMSPPRAPITAQAAGPQRDEAVRVPSKSSGRRAAPSSRDANAASERRERLFQSPRMAEKAEESRRPDEHDIDAGEPLALELDMSRATPSRMSAAVARSPQPEGPPAMPSRGKSASWLSTGSGPGDVLAPPRQLFQKSTSLSDASWSHQSSSSHVRTARAADPSATAGVRWDRDDLLPSPADSPPSAEFEADPSQGSEDGSGQQQQQHSPRPQAPSSASASSTGPRRSLSGVAGSVSSIFRFGMHGNAATVVPI